MRAEWLADRTRVEHVARGLEAAAQERVRGAAEPDAPGAAAASTIDLASASDVASGFSE